MGKIIVIPSYSIPHPINGPKYVVSFLLNHGFPMLSVNCFLFFLGGKGKTFRRTPAPGTLATPFRTEPLAALVFPVAGLREKNNGKSYENPMKMDDFGVPIFQDHRNNWWFPFSHGGRNLQISYYQWDGNSEKLQFDANFSHLKSVQYWNNHK